MKEKLLRFADGKGIEWAYRKYLNGKDGKILKQKIAKGSGSLFVM
jgi:cell division protein FtsI (penicillin-binding protein 3)